MPTRFSWRYLSMQMTLAASAHAIIIACWHKLHLRLLSTVATVTHSTGTADQCGCLCPLAGVPAVERLRYFYDEGPF